MTLLIRNLVGSCRSFLRFYLQPLGCAPLLTLPLGAAAAKPPLKEPKPDACLVTETSTAGLNKMRLQSSGGQMVVRAAPGTMAVVRATPSLGGKNCCIESKRVGDTWEVRTRTTGTAVCELALDVALPAATEIDLLLASGDLRMSGMTGILKLELNQGNAVVGNALRRLTAHLGQGSLSAQGLRGDAQLTLDRGNLQVYAHPDMQGSLAFDVEHGQVTLVVPPHPIALSVETPRGSQSTNVTVREDAPLVIKGRIGQGNLKVRSSS